MVVTCGIFIKANALLTHIRRCLARWDFPIKLLLYNNVTQSIFLHCPTNTPMLHYLYACIMRVMLKVVDMHSIYDQNAPKKPTNLTVNSDLLTKARNLKINLSATLESALELKVRHSAREKWLKENKNAIASLNELTENNGLFSDSYREL